MFPSVGGIRAAFRRRQDVCTCFPKGRQDAAQPRETWETHAHIVCALDVPYLIATKWHIMFNGFQIKSYV